MHAWHGLGDGRALRVRARAYLLIAVGAALTPLHAGCGEGSGAGDAGVDLGPADGPDLAVPLRDPTEHPPHRIIPNHGGPVVANPEVYVVAWEGDEDTGLKAMRFFEWMFASQYWSQSVAQYGVGPGRAEKLIVRPGAPPGAHTAIPSMVAAMVGEGAIEANANTLVMFILPKGAVFADYQGRTGCSGAFAYHSATSVSAGGDAGTMQIPYAVHKRCSSFGGGGSWEELTEVLSHEAVEAATEPFPGGPRSWSILDPKLDTTWGGEVSDQCANLGVTYVVPYTVLDGGVGTDTHLVTRNYSNEVAVLQNQDPCVPSSGPYFNVALEVPDGGIKNEFHADGGVRTELLIKPYAYADVGKIKWRLRLFEPLMTVTPESGENLPGETVRVQVAIPARTLVPAAYKRIQIDVNAEKGGKNQVLDAIEVR